MRFLKSIGFSFYVFSFLWIGFPSMADNGEPEILIGLSEIDITPPVGYSHYRGVSTGINDSLYAKAVVFGEEGTRFAIVVCDLLWVERKLSSEVRLIVHRETNIPYSNIIISGTHTHNSPGYSDNIHEINSHRRSKSYSAPMIKGKEYSEWLIERVSQAVINADKNSVSSYIEQGKGLAENLSFNRRSILKGGQVVMNAGVGNPDIVGAAGSVDPQINILMFRKVEDNQLIGCLSNFGLHPATFGGAEYSADFPGFISRALKEEFGEDFVSIFATGACGDINHINVKEGSKRRSTEEIGNILASIIINEISNSQKLSEINQASISEFVYAPLQQFSEKELEWAMSEKSSLTTDQEDPINFEKPYITYRRGIKIRSLQRMRESGEAIAPTIGEGPWMLPLYAQVLKINSDLAIVGLPGELFTELSLAIKRASPFKMTIIIELNNNYIGYVPTKRAFKEGSYETVNSRLAPGGGELMVEATIHLLNEIFK